ncbi:MAG TPA: prepilin-type N-terminal cleavage/methylation domain-containing protein [Gemmatimonadaceae bacterium]|nr:prepilin-type N-terminal cleavage/methylation domain-containing protein [Gemmatimonadaceae bacterium]
MTAAPPITRSAIRQSLRRGFSLIEILVTVGLIGIALYISIPRVSRLSNQSRVQRAARMLQAEVQQAFAIAGRNRVPIRLTWNSSALQLQVTNLAGNTVFRRAGVGSGSFGLTASDVTMTPATLTVFPNGLADDSLRIVVSRSGFTQTVRVARSGMIRSR